MHEKRLGARKHAYTILKKRELLKLLERYWSTGITSEEAKTQIIVLLQQIVDLKQEIRRLGYNANETLDAAEAYQAQLLEDAKGPKPVTSKGAGLYKLGNKRKNW